MDLRSRSSRSRSKTPATFSSVQQQEALISESSSTVRITRSKVKTYESSSASSAIFPSTEQTVRSRVHRKVVTSDYSSGDDYDNEVTSSLQNCRNHTLENVNRTNGSGQTAAIKIYRQAGDYWNKYPKTDYTYSRHSKDRVEISPGVVQMPNMSRRPLRDSPTASGASGSSQHYVVNKACATDSFFTSTQLDVSAGNASASEQQDEMMLKPRKLFGGGSSHNNNNYNGIKYSSRSGASRQETSIIVSIFRYVMIWITYLYRAQSDSVLYVMKKFYRFCSWIMLVDRWLLHSRPSYSGATFPGTTKKLLWLCLVPLFLFGGWFAVTGLVSSLSSISYDQLITTQPTTHTATPFKPISVDEVISSLTDAQLQQIALKLSSATERQAVEDDNSDRIIAKLLTDPSVAEYISNLHKLTLESHVGAQAAAQDADDPQLAAFGATLHQHGDHIQHLQSQMALLRHQLGAQLRSCCRGALLHTERYVFDIVRDLFGAPAAAAVDQDEFRRWFGAMFAARKDVETALANITEKILEQQQRTPSSDELVAETARLVMDSVVERLRAEMRSERSAAIGGYESKEHVVGAVGDENWVRNIVRDVLAVYDADKTGLVDYALESAGAQIVSTRCTESHQPSTAVISIFGIPVWYPTNTPRTILSPGVVPGECWAFEGFPGYVVIKLTARIHIEAVSYEHISRRLVPNGRIDSAPKSFTISGVTDLKTDPVPLGEFVYDVNGEPLQFFAMPPSAGATPYQEVELRVNTNLGHPQYTCLYRFRVHGRLANPPS